MKKGLILLMLFWAQLLGASESSLLVGNAGEGMIFEGKLYLRDLLEFGFHENPVIGEKMNPNILRALLRHPSFSKLPVDMKLMARKLTELDELSPRFGFYVLTAIEKHRWLLYSPPLKSFKDDGSFVDLERVPLANRFQLNIRLQDGRFQALPEVHKVALIVHEAVSSFQKVEHVKNYSVLDEHRLREAVAVMFSDWSDRKEVLKSYLDNYSAIPPFYVREDYPLEDLLPYISLAGFQTPPPNSYIQYNLTFSAAKPKAPHLAKIIEKHRRQGYPIYLLYVRY